MDRTPDELLDSAVREWVDHWPTEVQRPARAAVSLQRAHALVAARCNAVLVPLGLSFSRYEALLDVHHAPDGERPFGALALRLEVLPGTVTKIVDGLERTGLLERRRHPSDRRVTVAAITPAGREAAQEATRALAAIDYGLEPLEGAGFDELLAVTRAVRGRPAPG